MDKVTPIALAQWVGCDQASLRKHYERSAAEMRAIAERCRATNGMYRGYTAEHAERLAREMLARANATKRHDSAHTGT